MVCNKGKGSIALIVIIAVSLCISAGIYFLFMKEHNSNIRLSTDLSESQAKNKTLAEQLDGVQAKVTELQTNLDDAQKQITSINVELAQERTQKTESGNQLIQLKKELDQQKSVRDELQKKLADSEQNVQSLGTRLKEMEAQLKDTEAVKIALENKVRAYEEKKSNVELGKIVVSQETGAPAAAASASVPASQGLEGKILVLNKDYNFAVINLGNKDGIAVGNTFSVIHNNKVVAELKIEKVHDSMSAAGFTPEIKSKIAEGDKVELKSK